MTTEPKRRVDELVEDITKIYEEARVAKTNRMTTRTAFTLNKGDVFVFSPESAYAGGIGRADQVDLTTNAGGEPVVRVQGQLLSVPKRLRSEVAVGDDFMWFALLDWTVELPEK